MQVRLKSITLNTSQESWKLNLPATLVPAARGANCQLHAQQARVLITEACITSTHVPAQCNKRGAVRSSEFTQDDDDDDFMSPMKHQSRGAGSSRSCVRDIGDTTSMNMPSVRCSPAFFTKFCEHLTMSQCRRISELGFGELLHFYAEDPGSSDLLVYLMDRLNPEFMIIEVGNEGGIELYDLSVNKVQGLPIGKKDPPCSTEEDNQRALVQFIGNFGFFLWWCLSVMTVQVGLSINFNHIRHLTITEAFVVLGACSCVKGSGVS